MKIKGNWTPTHIRYKSKHNADVVKVLDYHNYPQEGIVVVRLTQDNNTKEYLEVLTFMSRERLEGSYEPDGEELLDK